MKRIMLAMLLLPLISGCAGLGLGKGYTTIPDEIGVGADYDTDKREISEVGGWLKWKLK